MSLTLKDTDDEQLDHKKEPIDIDLDDIGNINFVKIVQDRRTKGVTKSSFDEDVEMWQNTAIASLPIMNECAIRAEIDTWELGIPREEYDLQVLQGVYSNLTAYQFRISHLVSLANSHYKTFSKAYKSLKIIAMALYSGTAKDKEAYAENEVHLFLIGTVKSENLYDYLCEVKEGIIFAATNMARILREREAQAKINTGHQSEGNAYKYSQDKEESEVEESAQSHTRRRSL